MFNDLLKTCFQSFIIKNLPNFATPEVEVFLASEVKLADDTELLLEGLGLDDLADFAIAYTI